MQMYPAYKFSDVWDEYAVRFFSLLNEGYRVRHTNYLILSQISDLPNADKKARAEFYKNLEWASKHPSDILKPSNQGSSPDEIKKMLQG